MYLDGYINTLKKAFWYNYGTRVCVNTNEYYNYENERMSKIYTLKINDEKVLKTASKVRLLKVLSTAYKELEEHRK